MMIISSYRDLQAWQKGMKLAVETYGIIKLLPKEERYGLCDQMRRAAVSIPSNIAEGYSRNASGEFGHFLNIAQGSKSELQTQLLLCEKLEFVTRKQIYSALVLSEEIGKMLFALQLSLKKKRGQ